MPDTALLLLDVPACARVQRAAAVRVSGADRMEWLQGQTTQDLRGMEAGSAARGCFLTPLGQIEAIVRAAVLEDAVVLVTDHPRVVLNRVEQFVIMEEVEAALLPGDVWTIQGRDAESLLSTDAGRRDGQIWLKSRRSAEGGWDIVGQPSFDFPEADPGLLDAAMLEAGEPVLGLDSPEKAVPADLGEAFFASHVSTTKGCYQGQEVVHRMWSRGKAPKRWCVLAGLDGPVDKGTAVLFEGKPAGAVMRSVFSPRKGWLASVMASSQAAESGQRLEVNGRQVALLVAG